MSLLGLLSQLGTIQTLGAAGTDRYNQPIEAVTVTTPDVPYRMQETEAIEVTVGESTAISTWKLFLLPDAVLAFADRFTDEAGKVFEVVGTPYVVTTPRGPHHIEARLRFIQ